MTKWICIKETYDLNLHHAFNEELYVKKICYGDVVEADEYFLQIKDNGEEYVCYIGFLDVNDNSYFNDDHAHHKIFKECFMPYIEWLAINREEQIRIVLDE
jgi:hypothetical protein